MAVFFTATQVSAQFVPYAPYPYMIFYNPFLIPPVAPLYPPVAPLFPTVPLVDPYLALPTPVSRAAAQTVVLLPTAATPVTAAAPLGTLNITPSTLVLLTLLLSLAE